MIWTLSFKQRRVAGGSQVRSYQNAQTDKTAITFDQESLPACRMNNKNNNNYYYYNI